MTDRYTAPQPAADETTRLHGRLLVAVRALVFTTIALTLVVYVLPLPRLIARMSTPCSDPLNACLISPQQVASLAQLGITPYALAIGVAMISYLAILLVCSVAGVLLWRRSDDWMALFVALTLVFMPSVFTPIMQGLPGGWEWIGVVYNNATFIALYLLMGLFPSGRFVPRWIWVIVLFQLVVGALPQSWTTALPDVAVSAVTAFAILFIYGSLIGGQIYRYRRVSTSTERQQTKWVVAGFILTLALNQLFWQPIIWIPALQRHDSLYLLLAGPDSFLMITVLAISFGVAILRYRLYDIDIIIRRTLIYGSLTAILAAVYVVGVIGMQTIVNTVTHKPGEPASPLLIVVTTLLIAALFQPLRRRIQRFIDRRFYRSRYDSRTTLDNFGAALRQEVDLATLTGQLVTVVHETLQPEHVSLWLRDTTRES